LRKEEDITPADELKDVYDLFTEVMENPEKMGYIVKMNKIKPMSRALINMRLFDRKNYYDWRIKDIIDDMLIDIGFD